MCCFQVKMKQSTKNSAKASSLVPIKTMLYQNNSINLTNSTAQVPNEYLYCQRFQGEEFFMANYLATLASIILNVLSCPVIIVMNALVIVAVKKRGRLQSMYRIVLAYMAGTDLLVGSCVAALASF